MSILSGNAIAAAVERGEIEIDPYEPAHLNPASIDLTLGDSLATYNDAGKDRHFSIQEGAVVNGVRVELDCAARSYVDRYMMPASGGVKLMPGNLYLMNTRERVHSRRYVSVLDGKSSIGRLGVVVHLTAGYVDPGFDGQPTLEVTVVHPVVVYQGMRFCQLRFHLLEGEASDYRECGAYTGLAATGPVPSMAWKQFERKR